MKRPCRRAEGSGRCATLPWPGEDRLSLGVRPWGRTGEVSDLDRVSWAFKGCKPWPDNVPTALSSSVRSRKSALPGRACTRFPSGMISRVSWFASGFRSMKPAPWDEDAQAADLLQEYEAKIAAWSAWLARQALEIEFLKRGSENAPRPRSVNTSVIAGPAASPSQKDAG